MYTLVKNGVIRNDDNTWMPEDPELNDYKDYLAWVNKGNSPAPEPNDGAGADSQK